MVNSFRGNVMMKKTYEDILQEVIDKATFEEIFDMDALQKMQDEFALSLEIASVITDVDGKPVTLPSNFTCLCADYVRMTEEGLRQCRCSDSVIGSTENENFTISKCLSAGLMDGGVSFYIGERHVGNWTFGQVRYPDEHLSDEMIIKKSTVLNIDPEDFEREYLKVPVMTESRFNHVAHFAAIVAKKYSDEAYLKCVHQAEEQYKFQIESEMQSEKERLQVENAIDFLTQLYNRNSFEQEVRKIELLQTIPVAVIVADVNNLKLTNDIFGHKFGDQLLAEIARIMKQESFDGFIIGRCGGDEFNILIPNGNRQDAEWFCHRVNIELEKDYNCCIMPSIAFGVSKKDRIEESIKDLMEIADQKMYRHKIQMKQKETFIEKLRRVLIGRHLITEEIMLETKQISEAFSEYMNFDVYKKDMFLHLNEIHNFGIVVLSDEVYSRRFETKHTIEHVRELTKVPVINSKVANLYPAYSSVAPLALSFYENFDGSGIPNGLSGTAIPELSRYGRIVCDFIYALYDMPMGMGLDRKAAEKMLVKNSGKLYDPDAVKSFRNFLVKY